MDGIYLLHLLIVLIERMIKDNISGYEIRIMKFALKLINLYDDMNHILTVYSYTIISLCL